MSTTVLGDFDGAAGDDIAIIDTKTVQIRTAASNVTKTYSILPWNTVSQVDLDGQPGLELLFTNVNVVGAVAQATVVTARSQQVHNYDLGRPNALQITDLDGQAGNEVLLTNVNLIAGVPQTAQATVLNQRLQQIRSFDIGKPNAMLVTDLDGSAGSEVLFTNLNVTAGIGQPALATVVTSRLSKVQTYDVGRPNAFQVIDLDGNAGPELLFTNLNAIAGVPQTAQATVVSSRAQEVRTYAVGQPNAFQVVELDGNVGPEVLFTNLSVVGGVGKSATATILSARAQQATSYPVGQPNAFQMAELDGTAGDEVLFTDVNAPGGVGQLAHATILSGFAKRSRTFEVGSPNTFQILDLDGAAGSEILFTNVNVVAGVAQQAQATILSGRSLQARSFEVGRPNALQIAELDGAAGPEVLFTNVVAGAAQTSQATILTGRTSQAKNYAVGRPNALQVIDLDGTAGSEVLFTDVNVIAGVPQTSQAIILTARSERTNFYQVGRPTAFQLAELDGQTGPELLFTSVNIVAGAPQSAQAAVITARTQDLRIYNVGKPNTFQLADLDSNAGLEVLFTDVTAVGGVGQTARATILTSRSQQVATYLVGQPNLMQLAELDGLAGSEVLFTNVNVVGGVAQAASATILNARTQQAKSYLVGQPNTFQLAELDGSTGLELLFTNLSVAAGVGQSATATVLSGRTERAVAFAVGQPNAMQLADLDGAAGDEVLFTDLHLLAGVPQAAHATILTGRTLQTQTYLAGRPNALQVVELDGAAGLEVLFTNVTAVGGVGQLAQASILNGRSQQVDLYSVGRPNAMQIVELDGSAGSEVLFTNVSVIASVAQSAQATVLTARTKQAKAFDVGKPNALQVVELDGSAGLEVLFTNVNIVGGIAQAAQATILSARTQLISTFDAGKPTSLFVTDLDGTAGAELVFVGPNTLLTIAPRSGDRTLYQVGNIGTIAGIQFDGLAGSELLVTRLDGTLGVLVQRTKQFLLV